MNDFFYFCESFGIYFVQCKEMKLFDMCHLICQTPCLKQKRSALLSFSEYKYLIRLAPIQRVSFLTINLSSLLMEC